MPTVGNIVAIEEIVVSARKREAENAPDGIRAVDGSRLSLETLKYQEQTISKLLAAAGTAYAVVDETGTTSLPQNKMTQYGDQYTSQKGDTTVNYAKITMLAKDGSRLDYLTGSLYGAASGDLDLTLVDTGETSASSDDVAYGLSLGLSWKNNREWYSGIAGGTLDYSYVCEGVSSGVVTYTEDTTDTAIGLGLGTYSSGDSIAIAVSGTYAVPTAQIAGGPSVKDPIGNASGAISAGASTFNGKVVYLGTTYSFINIMGMNSF